MIKMIWLCLLALAGTTLHLKAQEPNPKPIGIGDKCPDFYFTNIINADKSECKLSDFKGKLVIIDFWATWCSPCIDALPKLNTLQREFGDKLIVLPVTSEAKENVTSFFKNRTILKNVTLPSLTEDLLLKKYFPHRTIPHEVWINGEGKVIAITDHEAVTATNIEKVLKGEPVALRQKIDILTRDFEKPLMLGALGDNYQFDMANVLFHSVLTKGIEGVSSVSKVVFADAGNSIKCIATNSSISTLYRRAFTNCRPPFTRENNLNLFLQQKARTIVEVADSNKYIGPEQFFGRSKKRQEISTSLRTYCYDMYIPKADSARASALMVADLNRCFGAMLGIEGVLEKRTIQCWALVRIGSIDKLLSKNKEKTLSGGVNNDSFIMKGYPLKEFFFWLIIDYMGSLPVPIINETGLNDEMVSMEIHADMKSPQSLGKALQKYGLDLKLVERELDMIIIRDKK